MQQKVFIVMGVAGAGKTTVGRLLANRLKCGFSDADEFHSPENIAKMSSGVPLDDEDRIPWLERMRAAIKHWRSEGKTHVLACSALRHSYRQILAVDANIVFVYLKVSQAVIAARLAERQHHYMKQNMVESQFATLEEPDPSEALSVDAELQPELIVGEIIRSVTDPSQPTKTT